MQPDNWTLATRTLLSTATCWLTLHAAAASAATLEVAVVDQNGAPLVDAIVYAAPLSGKLPAAKPCARDGGLHVQREVDKCGRVV